MQRLAFGIRFQNGAKACIGQISARAFQRVFTCKIWLRYSQERASPSLKEIWNLNGIWKFGWVKNPIQIPRKMNLNCEARELVDHERLPSCQRLGFHVDSPSACGNHPTRLLRHRDLGEIGFLLPPERRKVLRRRRNQVEFSEIEFLLQHPLAVVTQGLLHQVPDRNLLRRLTRGGARDAANFTRLVLGCIETKFCK